MEKRCSLFWQKAIIEPKLTKYEESKLKKIISKCLSDNVKQQYQKISEILFDFPQLKYKKTNKNKKIKWIIVGTIVLFGWRCEYVSK